MSDRSTKPTPKTTVIWLLSVMLGLTFIGAAVAKFNYSVQLEKDILRFFGMLEGGWNPYIAGLARLLIIGELALGLGMLQPYWRKRLILPVSMVILAGFIVYLFSLPAGVENCGCLGAWIEMTPRQSLIKNVVLVLGSGALWVLLPKDPKGKLIIPCLVTVVSAALVIGSIPIKPTTFGNIDKDFSHMTAFQPTSDISNGVAIVCFFSATCEHCLETADTLAGLGNDEATLFYAFLGEAEDITRFRDDVGLTDVPFCSVSADVFFSNIGDAPPRVYLLQNGRAVDYWDGTVDLTVIRNRIKKLK